MKRASILHIVALAGAVGIPLAAQQPGAPPLSQKLIALVGVPMLYIQALDDPELAETTRQMFLKAPEPHEQAIIQHGNFVSLNDEEKRAYENRVVSFFLVRLPPVGQHAR